MAENFDTSRFYKKLADNEPLTEDEIVSLLKAVDTYQAATAHLAECHAATAESMPKSASKSARRRYTEILRTAARLLDGDVHAIRFRARPDAAQERCLRTAAEIAVE